MVCVLFLQRRKERFRQRIVITYLRSIWAQVCGPFQGSPSQSSILSPPPIPLPTPTPPFHPLLSPITCPYFPPSRWCRRLVDPASLLGVLGECCCVARPVASRPFLLLPFPLPLRLMTGSSRRRRCHHIGAAAGRDRGTGSWSPGGCGHRPDPPGTRRSLCRPPPPPPCPPLLSFCSVPRLGPRASSHRVWGPPGGGCPRGVAPPRLGVAGAFPACVRSSAPAARVSWTQSSRGPASPMRSPTARASSSVSSEPVVRCAERFAEATAP